MCAGSAMFIVTENPTTTLAGQYERTFSPLCSSLSISVGFPRMVLIDYSRTHIINENLLRESHLLLLMLTSVYPLWWMRITSVFGVPFAIRPSFVMRVDFTNAL